MVVIDLPMPPKDVRQTERFANVSAATVEAMTRLKGWLAERGTPPEAYTFDAPMAFGTFAAVFPDNIAKLLRTAPGVQAVMEIG
jgi:hypothetical protein